MRIAYLARFEHDWSTETHVAREAETLGHTVDRIVVRTDRDFLAELEERASDAELLVCHATGLPAAAVDTWRRLEQRDTRTVSYHLDLYRGLRRERQIGADPFWRTGTVFTADGDPETTAKLAVDGVHHQWLPAAVASDETDRGEWRDEYDHDIVFVGSQHYHLEWPWRTELLTYLKSRYGERFAIYEHHPPIRGRDLNDLYATARVVVGDTLALPGHRNYWSDRYYETIGRGGFLVAPWVSGIDEHFTDEQHLRYYPIGDTHRLGQLVDQYLEHPDQARAIADQGQAHVRANHTYKNRIDEMLAHLTVRT